MEAAVLGPTGFGLAAAASGAFAAVALARHAERFAARLFIGALATQAVWALTMSGAGDERSLASALAPLLESIRVLVWTAFLLALGNAGGNRAARGAVLALAGITGALAAAGQWQADPSLGWAALRVAALVLALLVLGARYLGAPSGQRWALGHLVLALGCILGFDLLMYIDILVASPDPVWRTTQGFVNLVAVPLLAAAASRNPAWQLDIALSRRIVVHTTTLLVGALYAGGLAGLAWYLRRFGGSWAEVAWSVLLLAAAAGLLAWLVSRSLRARIRVFVSKHFFDYRYDYREEWLRLTRLLAEGSHTSSRALAERGIEGIGSLVESRGGALWLREGRHYELAGQAGRSGMEPGPIAAAAPVLAWMTRRRWIIDLNEWRSNPERYAGLSIDAPLDDARGWIVVPMIIHDELAGLVVLDRPRTRVELDWEVRDVLKVAAAQVASFLVVQRATERLAQAEQFASFNRLSTFIVHDLKNLVAQLSLMSANAVRHRDDPAFVDDMIATVDTVAERMQAILAGLRTPVHEAGAPVAVPVGDVLEEVVQAHAARQPRPVLAADPGTGPVFVFADRARLRRVLGHLVQNAVEACSGKAGAEVTVSWRGDPTSSRITVVDTGRGMSAQFMRERLFRPFFSTKSQGMGIGLFECREYVREIGGSLAVESSPSRGTRFTVILPLADSPSDGAPHE